MGSTGRVVTITIKVDIAKVFDTLSWEFLFSCLHGLGVPRHFLKLLCACICKTSFMVGYNGTINGYFKGIRGLRQGDPLSLYLFVIPMNFLSHMLNSAASQARLRYHKNCEKIKLTHLSFADDQLLFRDGSEESVQCVQQVLKEFEEQSGLAVSMQKTSFLLMDCHRMRSTKFKCQQGCLVVAYLSDILEFP